MKRKYLLTIILATTLVLRAQAPESPALVFVLVDTSLSIPDLTGFRSAWNTVMLRAVGGDRIVIAVVSGRVAKKENSTITEIADRELPRKGWNDNPITYDESLASAKTMLASDFDAALSRPRPDSTELLRSIRDASRYLGAEKGRQKILVILSDMLQDSAEYRFAKIPLSEAFTRTVIAKAQNGEGLPDLNGVAVFTQVPGVAEPAKADQVEKFWTSYLSACGAKLDQHTYGTLANYRRPK